MGYPDPQEEREILRRHQSGFRARDLDQIDLPALLDPAGVLALQSEAMAVTVVDDVLGYAAELGAWLRASPDVLVGPSPRGTIALVLSAKVMAAARGDAYVTPDDLQSLALPVLRHRIVLSTDAELSGRVGRRRGRPGARGGRGAALMVTRRGVIALAGVAALVVVAWPVGLAGWAFAAGNLLVLAAIAADWLAAEPGAIELERPEPEPLSVGRENAVHLIVHNGSSRPRRVVVGDGPPPRTRLWPTTATVELGAQDELTVDQTLVPRARGPVRFPAAEVRVTGPLGLAFRERSHPATAIEAVAIADVIQLRERNLLPSGRRIGGLRAIRAEAVGREFESLREYVPRRRLPADLVEGDGPARQAGRGDLPAGAPADAAAGRRGRPADGRRGRRGAGQARPLRQRGRDAGRDRPRVRRRCRRDRLLRPAAGGAARRGSPRPAAPGARLWSRRSTPS